MMNIIEINRLTKDYKVGFWIKKPRRALDDLSLRVEEGEIFGFLGPNGAGKTTTLKILMCLIRPSSGTATIMGRDIGDINMHQHIGFLPENPYFYDYLTAEEYLHYAAQLFGFSRAAARNRVQELLERVGLRDGRKTQLRKFSKGMIQRIGIAQAIINDPKVVFLDEPMSGLDPVGRREVRDIITELRSKGVTVFFSSHILSDVESICDRVAILNKGKLLDSGKLTDILRIEVASLEVIASGVDPTTLEELKACSEHMELLGERARIVIPKDTILDTLLSRIHKGNGKLISVNPIRESLEDFFVKRIEG
jgi:ABC-2 type transport system ATP-binding protein